MNDLPLPKVPVHETLLPVSKQKVKFRPFLVKEEKILLMAMETEEGSKDVVEAIKQIITNCTMNNLDVDKTPVADIEYMFIQIRKKSISENIDSYLTCNECGNKIDYKVNLDNVEVLNEIKDRNINLGDGFIVTMKYPTLETTKLIVSDNQANVSLETVGSMIEMLTHNEVVYDMVDFPMEKRIAWLEGLQTQAIDKLEEFIKALPKVVYADQITCTCGNKINVYLEGLESFFG